MHLFLCYASIILLYFIRYKTQKRYLPVYHFVSDSNKLLALTMALSLFSFFKTLKLGTNKVINTLAASTFPILLIHASSDTMRKWLWQDVAQTQEAIKSKYFIFYAIMAVVAVYFLCFCLDFIRKVVQKGFTKIGASLCKKNQSQ